MFIAVLFTIAKIWKQPKCPSEDEGIIRLWYIYTVEYYPAIKKKDLSPCATATDGPGDYMLSEVSKSEKEKYHMISLIHEIYCTK